MKTEEIIKKCHEIAKDPMNFLTREKSAKGLKYLGYTCIFIPEELFHAAGYTPVRILGFSKKTINVEKYLTSNCCEFAKSLVESFQSAESNVWDSVVFSHCCDTLQVVADIAPQLYAQQIFRFDVPTNFDGHHSMKYLNTEVTKLKTQLEEHIGESISEESLLNSWHLYTENRRLLKRLYALRKDKAGVISGSDSMAVIIAGLFMPKEEFNRLLQDLTDELETKEDYDKPEKRMILSGITNGNVDLVRLIEQSGCTVVSEDLCETSRILPQVIEEEFVYPDSFSRLIESRYCPVKHYIDLSYHKLLLNMYEAVKADGLIITLFPFCDPQIIEYAALKRKLAEQKIKSLMVEVVLGNNNFPQIQTRIEAFLESLN